MIENIDPIVLPSGERLTGRIKYFDYGVVSIELESCFERDWRALIELSSRWIGAPDIEQSTIETVQQHLERVATALVKPYASWLSEDYYIIHIENARGLDGDSLRAEDLLKDCGASIAQIVRGEKNELSDAERTEVLNGALSYYPSDLLVVGWTAALAYDSDEGATPLLQLLEHANAHLLELRHYDGTLTDVLREVHHTPSGGRCATAEYNPLRRQGAG